jgi:CRP-like cAMP-binding protein
VVEQGLPQAFLHLVLDGEFRIFVKSDDAILPLGYAKAGDAVGEMSLLEPIDASAMVVAHSTSHDWCINRARFDEFAAAHPIIAVKVLKAVAIQLGQRLRKGSERLIEAES